MSDEEPAEAKGSNGLRIAVAIIAVLLIAAVVWGIVTWRRAEQWRDRADDRGATVEQLEGEVESTNQEIAALETRLDELASEKAGTEDEREAAVITADQLEELVRQAGLVATDLDTCARGAVDVVNLVNSLGDYDVEEVNTYVANVQDVCGRALGENDALQQAIDALDQPPTTDADE